VICGHIHQPQKRLVKTKKGECTYLNSGDWIENLSALEYENGNWNIVLYDDIKHDIAAAEAPEEDFPNLNIEDIIQFRSAVL